MTNDDKRGSVGHTPGPWTAAFSWRGSYGDRNYTGFHIACAPTGSGHPVAEYNGPTVGYERRSNEEIVANARLIAAAPAMFEALQLVWEKVLTEYHSRDSYVRKQVEAAIALAQPTPETEGHNG